MFTARYKNYVPLLGKDQLGRGDCESPGDFSPSTPCLDDKQPRRWAISWTLVIVIVCTFLNVTLSVFPNATRRAPQATTHVTRQNIHLLRRPNQYIGFDEIQRPSPPIDRQVTTFPILLSLVDAASPDAVFADDFAAYMVHSGTITPDDRRIRVTSTMSTIFQFRAIDWGMEICELHIDLPESFGQDGHSGSSLALYRINSTMPLDSSSLSHNNRPPRIAKLGNIELGNGLVRWHRKFNCVTDEVLSFELGCLPLSESGGDSDCFVELIQVLDVMPNIYVVQHSTK